MTNAQAVRVERVGDLVHVVIDNPPVNATGQSVRAGLLDATRQIDTDPAIRAVVLRCAGRTFVAGADIRELGKPPQEPFLPDVIAAIEASRKPWVAAIHGSALGGGLEIAMGCHGRVADPGASFGLPEVTLGIIPGAGGTVRLPRLVGLAAAVDMITGGKPINAGAALASGLIDAIAHDDLIATAELHARRMTDQGPLKALSSQPPPDAPTSDFWETTELALRRKARDQTAPIEALAALRDSCEHPVPEAFARERARFLRLSNSAEAAALRHIFFAERNAGSSLRRLGAPAADLEDVGVVGGGLMGAGIATAAVLAGSRVILVERDEAAAATAADRVAGNLKGSVDRGAISAEAAAAAAARLSTCTDIARLAACTLVIEAVFEDMDLKADVFSRLDAVVGSDAILATNTSYLDVNVLAAGTKAPGRVLGLHFFSPAHVMKLLEIVRGAETDDRALATGYALAKRLGKTPVVSGVCDGFIGNRIMSAYRRECDFLLEEGALPEQVDNAMRRFGFAMGIFEMQDMAGLDIAWAMRKRRARTRPKDERYSRLADQLCESGRLGRKSGAGWYLYEGGKRQPDPVVTDLIEAESRQLGLSRKSFSDETIMARIIEALQAEARAVCAEGIADSPDDIDVVMVRGYGFPRHRGGPMFMASC